MLQPILKLVRERESYSKKTKEEIKDIEIEIGEMKEAFISKENDARKDASQKRSNVIHSGLGEAEGVINKSREEVLEIRKKADGEAEAEIDNIKPLLGDQAALLVDGSMAKLIGRRVRA